ncbi:hypothetical protein GUY40_00280 [Pseudomonas sp. R5(2019)]|nr:S-type pyocin domain-containing protein [Pseudomonas sp. R5(2019)]NBA93414.1 hypothetical protein [Pseudomonas sp. R5(2019)]
MSEGYVNIVHGSSSSSGSGGFFGNAFTRPGRSSRKRRMRRLRAREQARQQQAIAAQQQIIRARIQSFEAARQRLDQRHAADLADSANRLQAELDALRPPEHVLSDVPGVYSILREKNVVDQLIAQKQQALQAVLPTAHSFYPGDPQGKSTEQYLAAYNALSAAGVDAFQRWHDAYVASQAAQQLNEALQSLIARSDALAARQAHKQADWQRMAERGRAFAEAETLRQADIKRLHSSEEARHQRQVMTAHTASVPIAVAAARPVLLAGASALGIEAGVRALEATLRQAVAELARVAAIPVGQSVGSFVTLMLYSPPLADGELSAELSGGRFQALVTPLDVLAPISSSELRKAAEGGTTVELPYRIKTETANDATKVHLVKTDGLAVPSDVPVNAAVHDPLRDVYVVQGSGMPPTTLEFGPASVSPLEPGVTSGLASTSTGTLVEAIPTGADTQCSDCIVVFPPSAGLEPLYIGFKSNEAGPGVVSGLGQSLDTTLQRQLTAHGSAAIASPMADQLRWRSFDSVEALRSTVWQQLAREPALLGPFETLNIRRMQQGFAPYAPRVQWQAGQQTFELTYTQTGMPAGADYNLDHMRITGPQVSDGRPLVTRPALPWSEASSAASQALTAALEQQRVLEQQRRQDQLEREAQEARRREAQRAANTYYLPPRFAESATFFTSPSGVIQDYGNTLQSALGLAISDLATEATANTGEVFASLTFPSPADAEFAFAVALPVLAPHIDLTAVPPSTFDLPYRIGVLSEGAEVAVFAVSTQSLELGAGVRVKPLQFDVASNSYSGQTDGLPTRTLTTTPFRAPGAELIGSTHLPAAPSLIVAYTGSTAGPIAPEVETYPAAEGDIDDYIYWFPKESGLAPLYVVFKNREGPRYEPGVVTGLGQAVEGLWLGAAVRGRGHRFQCRWRMRCVGGSSGILIRSDRHFGKQWAPTRSCQLNLVGTIWSGFSGGKLPMCCPEIIQEKGRCLKFIMYCRSVMEERSMTSIICGC